MNMLENIKKALSSITAAVPFIYLLGFVIVNTYLSKFGVYDMDVISANYLKAGIFFVFFTSFSIAGIFLIFVNDGVFETSLKKQGFLLSFALLASSTLAFVIFRASANIRTPWAENDVRFAIGFSLYSLLLLISALGWLMKWERLRESSFFHLLQVAILIAFIYLCIREASARWFILIFIYFTFSTLGLVEDFFKKEYRFTSLPFTFFNLIGIAAIFGISVYNGLPPTYGGAKMKVNQILFKDSVSVNSAKYLELKQVEILYTGSEFYVIKLSDSTFIQIPKDNLQSAIFLQR